MHMVVLYFVMLLCYVSRVDLCDPFTRILQDCFTGTEAIIISGDGVSRIRHRFFARSNDGWFYNRPHKTNVSEIPIQLW